MEVNGIRLTGLWENSKDGKRWLSGSLGGGRLMIYRNENKKNEKEPDFNVYLYPAVKSDKVAEKKNVSSSFI